MAVVRVPDGVYGIHHNGIKVGEIQRINVWREEIDITSFSDLQRQYAYGGQTLKVYGYCTEEGSDWRVHPGSEVMVQSGQSEFDVQVTSVLYGHAVDSAMSMLIQGRVIAERNQDGPVEQAGPVLCPRRAISLDGL
jgi:hypothetical protein